MPRALSAPTTDSTSTERNRRLLQVPQIEPDDLSWSAALDRLGGSRELFAQLARDFTEQFRDEADLVHALVERGDYAEALRRLHGLKGVAANLGADPVAEETAHLEEELRRGPTPRELSPGLERFRHVLGGTIDVLLRLADRLGKSEIGAEPARSDQAAEASPQSQRGELRFGASPVFERRDLPRAQRLLVVDDQPVVRRIVQRIFEDDHEVFSAASGAEALDLCRRQPPDLVLLDIVMPDLDGIETCKRLQADPDLREIPVIFVTSENRPDQEARALDHGAVDFISKPLNPAVVRARVNTHLTLKRQADMLKSLAFVDGLTGIGNRRLFDQRLDLEWRSCRRNGSDLSLLMVDIDYFKRFNDRCGHVRGDACLRDVANVLRQELQRPRDFVARYGGEEFACLLPETDAAGAEAKARSLRRAVAARRLPHPDSECSDVVTVCIGVATTRPGAGDGSEALLAAADAELYRAKEAGRDRVCAARLDAPPIRLVS